MVNTECLLDTLNRDVSRTLTEGGGGEYSYIAVLPDEFISGLPDCMNK